MCKSLIESTMQQSKVRMNVRFSASLFFDETGEGRKPGWDSMGGMEGLL
jgi:hypothetical protein